MKYKEKHPNIKARDKVMIYGKEMNEKPPYADLEKERNSNTLFCNAGMMFSFGGGRGGVGAF